MYTYVNILLSLGIVNHGKVFTASSQGQLGKSAERFFGSACADHASCAGTGAQDNAGHRGWVTCATPNMRIESHRIYVKLAIVPTQTGIQRKELGTLMMATSGLGAGWASIKECQDVAEIVDLDDSGYVDFQALSWTKRRWNMSLRRIIVHSSILKALVAFHAPICNLNIDPSTFVPSSKLQPTPAHRSSSCACGSSGIES